MAFVRQNLILHVVGHFAEWRYHTPDTLAEVESPNYFDPAADLLSAGDVIKIRAENRYATCRLVNIITVGWINLGPETTPI